MESTCVYDLFQFFQLSQIFPVSSVGPLVHCSLFIFDMKSDTNNRSPISQMGVFRKLLFCWNWGQKTKFGPKMDAQDYISRTTYPIFLIFGMKLDTNNRSPMSEMGVFRKLLFCWNSGRKPKFDPKMGLRKSICPEPIVWFFWFSAWS